jgi:aconitate hydratase
VNTPTHPNSFGARDTLRVGDRSYTYFRLDALAARGHDIATLPFSLKVLLENLLRYEDGRSVEAADVEALARWNPRSAEETEIAFRPARVLLQDFTGVPRCATRSPRWAAIRPGSIRCSRSRS